MTRTALQMSFTFSVAAYVVIKSLLLWSVINYEESADIGVILVGNCSMVIPGMGWIFRTALWEPSSEINHLQKVKILTSLGPGSISCCILTIFVDVRCSHKAL